MLRLHLPPNLAAAAARDAIAVKVELDLKAAPPESLWPVLGVLQRLCGTAQPPSFLQLKRAQLRDLVGAATGLPLFRWVQQPDTPILWVGPVLRGVSEVLKDPNETPDNETRPAGVVRGPARASDIVPGAVARTVPRAEAARPAGPTGLGVDGSEQFLALTLPSREHSSYSRALELVKSHGFMLEPSNRRWWLRDRSKVLTFLARYNEVLKTEFFAQFSDNFLRHTARLQTATLDCAVAETADGFAVTVGLKAGKVSEEKLLQAAAANRGFVEEGDSIVLLPPAVVERLGKAQRALSGAPQAGGTTRRTHRLGYARLAEAEDILEELSPQFQPPEAWRARSEALRHLTKLIPAPVPAGFTATLRPYQQVGVAWLWHLHRHALGGILADEMGLGKTLQALGLLLAAHAGPEAGRDRPSLVVCPASLVENWLREAARFAPSLRWTRHHGSDRWQAGRPPTDVIVTSYGTLARDRDLFANLDLECLIADEAQHLKNRRTQNAAALRSLRARGRVLLTGTPLENSVDDLRSLFEILLPGYLETIPPGTRAEERDWFDDRLRAKTAPYLLRRTKQAVAPELPAKIEQVLYCELSAAQARLYREVQESTERALLDLEASGASEGALRMATLTQLLRLRQVCCDPRLLPGAPREAESAKLDLFRELLSEAVDDGHRLLVFSQFTTLLGLLKEELEAQGMAYAYLDGSMAPRARQAEVDRFQKDAAVPVFLISLKAGGTGLNLTGADTVVHFDPWWNPAVEAQATDRAHRLGQTRVVTSYKFICSGTVEEKVLQLQETKRALLADVFEASDAAAAKLSLDDLRSLLR